MGLSQAIAKLELLGSRLGRTVLWWRKYFWLATSSNEDSEVHLKSPGGRTLQCCCLYYDRNKYSKANTEVMQNSLGAYYEDSERRELFIVQ